MDFRKVLGILFIILGLIFAIYPMYSAGAVSLIAGISLIAFGFASIIDGFSLWSRITHVSAINIFVGICAILLGILFIYEIDALSFIIAFNFYIIAFILIIAGITGIIIGPDTLSRLASVLILILGFVVVYLAAFSIANPLYCAIIVGICLIMYGITFLASGLIES
ncbi:DUF308 domain-containing protein [uncultured Methanobrevibacter sp.]|uniref:DUF308 domain-containing protein n=1 Tax=uncultured Methanobrevibacter sp. TaxID=253161 RepID=UPI0025D0B0B9|nr:DUF308 domain-containing protein [uncultured Methanobrevibacter sp.]